MVQVCGRHFYYLVFIIEHLQVFSDEVNLIDWNIQFTLETEQNGKLPHLVIELIKK